MAYRTGNPGKLWNPTTHRYDTNPAIPQGVIFGGPAAGKNYSPDPTAEYWDANGNVIGNSTDPSIAAIQNSVSPSSGGSTQTGLGTPYGSGGTYPTTSGGIGSLSSPSSGQGSSSGGYSSDPASNLAQISREQFNLSRRYATPEVNALLRNLDPSTYGTQIDASGNAANSAFTVASADANRLAKGYGIGFDKIERANVSRNANINRASNVASARNKARGQILDRRDNVTSALMGIGRNYSSQSTQGLQGASSLATGRKNAQAASDAQDFNNIMQIGGLAAAFLI